MIRISTISAAAAFAILAAPAADAQSVAATRAWMSSASRWTEPYVRLNADYAAFVGRLIKDEVASERYFKSGDTAAGAAWARTWRADQLSRYASLKARAVALGVTAPPPIPTGVPADPRTDTANKGLAAMAPIIIDEVMNGETMVNETVTLGVRAAGGDRVASDQLVQPMMALQVAGLKSEIAQSSIDFALPGDPSADADDAVVQVDRAALAITEAAQAAFAGRPLERVSVAAAVRVHANGIDADADAMERHSALLLKKLGARPGQMPNAVVAAFTTGMQTFPQSAGVERKIAVRLRAIATLVERPDSTPLQWEIAVSDNLDDLLGQAAELSARRRAAVAG